jgi:GAF domain-containing protein
MTADLATIRGRLLEHADLDAALKESAPALCGLLGAERISVYAARKSGDELLSLLSTGLETFGHLKLPANAVHSVAGYVAVNRRLVNIANAYDLSELAAFQPPIRFFQEVDKRSGFRTREVLGVPITDGESGKLLGVLQILNSLDGRRFPRSCEEAAVALCGTLATAIPQHDRRREPG